MNQEHQWLLNDKYNGIETPEFHNDVKRLESGEPLAYVIGWQPFCGTKIYLDSHPLIPRPETEWLMDKALSTVKSEKWTVDSKKKTKVRILDVGTGSGCIAISLAHTLSTVHCSLFTVTASDVSASALKVAEQNAKTHKTKVTFIQSDLFSKIPGTFNIITANLPYVPQGMYELLYHNLKYEPKVAITDGGEVWDMYRRFFEQLPKHLATGGVALLEIDDGSKSDLQKMIKRLLPGYKTSFYKDLNGLWRYLEIKS